MIKIITIRANTETHQTELTMSNEDGTRLESFEVTGLLAEAVLYHRCATIKIQQQNLAAHGAQYAQE